MSITFGKPRFVDEDEEPKRDGNSLPKFLVHFRRPDDYRGEFGFDWIRDEYIYPIVKVAIDNKGYTDNYMDYTWQRGENDSRGGFFSTGDNTYKGKMYSFFKWQWDIMRRDRSLTFNY